MPSRKGLKATVAVLVPQQIEEILRPPPVPLSLEEREELRRLFSTPLMRKVWNNVRGFRPNSGLPKAELNSALGGVFANNRLHEMRGWDAFETAFILQAHDPKPLGKTPVLDNYPDSGLPK